jgi:hypothetical protein
VPFFAGFIEALEMLGAELDGEALDVLRVVAPSGNGDFAERLCGTEFAACQWHVGMVAGAAVSVVSPWWVDSKKAPPRGRPRSEEIVWRISHCGRSRFMVRCIRGQGMG